MGYPLTRTIPQSLNSPLPVTAFSLIRSDPLPLLWEALAKTSNKRTVGLLAKRALGRAESPRKKIQLNEEQQQQEQEEQQEQQEQQEQRVREENGNDASSWETEQNEHRCLMGATLESALFDRFKAVAEGDEETYEKAFKVLQHVEIESGGVVAARVARFVEEMLGLQGGRVALCMDKGDEGRMVDWFLEDVADEKYDED